MNRKLLVVTAALSSFLLLSAFGCSRHDFRDPERVRKMVSWKVEDAMEDVDATDAQIAQAQAVAGRLVDPALALRAEHKKARVELLGAFDQPKPDAARAHAIVDGQLESIRGFAHQVVDAAAELHGILNAEQRAKISERLHERLARHDGR